MRGVRKHNEVLLGRFQTGIAHFFLVPNAFGLIRKSLKFSIIIMNNRSVQKCEKMIWRSVKQLYIIKQNYFRMNDSSQICSFVVRLDYLFEEKW